MLSIKRHIPVKLHSLLESFWYIDFSSKGVPFEEVIIPDGHQEIIFHDKPGNAERSAGRASWIKEPACLILGQTTKPYRLRLSNHSKLIGIRFLPHTINLFIDVPAKEFTDTPQAAAHIAGVKELLGYIDFDAPAKTFYNLENALVRLLDRKSASSAKFSYVNFAVNTIVQENGNCRIGDIVEKTGISLKYLNTLFGQWLGISPKTFSNIIRMSRFLEIIKNDPGSSLTTASHASGFFDQAHLIKSFKRFAGVLPKEYLDQQTSINDYFVSGRK